MQARRLPVNVPLVRAETIDSYLARLARANHLSLRDFRAHLGLPPTRNGRVDSDRLSVMTGHQPDRLSEMIVGSGPWSGRGRVSPLPASRAACRRCTAARGIRGDVHRVTADLRVCRPHRRWLGALGDGQSEQYDLSRLPEVVHAQRRHHRLLHRHGRDAGRTALFWATHISDRWTERGDWDQHRLRRQQRYLTAFPHHVDATDTLAPMLNYPETVTLAGLLASEHWSTLASSRRRQDRNRFDAEVARRLHIPYRSDAVGEPLVDWQEGEALARRRRAHEHALDHTGLDEVWLAGPTCPG